MTLPVNPVYPTMPWQAGLPYLAGASVTPLNENSPAVPRPQYQFVCVVAGTSGAIPPRWANRAGVIVTDNAATWLCNGIYLDEGNGTAFAAPKPSAA